MLVLSRKKGQSIIIREDIEVKILDIKGGYVSVGITAPQDVNVFRLELLEQIRKDNGRTTQKGRNLSRLKNAVTEDTAN